MNLISYALLILFSFVPPLIYAVWIRNTERYQRQSWFSIAVCFLWGASIAIIAALILEHVLHVSLSVSIQRVELLPFLSVVLVAPVVEECVKPFALRLKTVQQSIGEYEDGLIYGAVAGLGFSATENLFYGWDFLSQGFIIFILLISIRSVGACFLHASATAMTGYGYGKKLLNKTSVFRIVPYLVVAICMHSFYNFVLTFDLIGNVFGLIIALIFSFASFRFIRKKIQHLDMV
ncbi:MAG: PrsW family glutamic-type intramembrane protease [Candidatus Thermoplasmatota archaeon]